MLEKLIQELRKISRAYNSTSLTGVIETLIADEKFIHWPASMDKHHNYEYGLLKHTIEVMNLCIINSTLSTDYRVQQQNRGINLETVLIAALLHDYGKTYTYEYAFSSKYTTNSTWKKTLEYTKSLHIYKSIDKAHELLDEVISNSTLQDVIHCIGAHHGRIDYGSLWEPNTPEAWILHLADMTSVFCIADRK